MYISADTSVRKRQNEEKAEQKEDTPSSWYDIVSSHFGKEQAIQLYARVFLDDRERVSRGPAAHGVSNRLYCPLIDRR